ncbi:MAG: alanine:cation symporter family protein, partial [Clostridia bacterium]|nr:alanine:cation symporter family protein [Clostridia bacterium]
GGVLCGMLEGVRRGVFTNEAGMGSSVMINASADGTDPVTAGRWGMFEVFADTMVMCTLTALAVIVSGAYPAAFFTASATVSGSEPKSWMPQGRSASDINISSAVLLSP